MGPSTVVPSSNLHSVSKRCTQRVSLKTNSLLTAKTLHRLWCSRGAVLTKQGYYEAALASFEAALRIQPNRSKTWVFHGVALVHLHHYKAALASFNRALDLSNTNREAWLFRGSVLKELQQYQEALFSYSQALKLQKQNSDVCRDYPMWNSSKIDWTLVE
ncbi:tetratricopeptide repeat protein [Phormidium sp. CLA17]|uniref:tetratricopeptide repeat protein n=1 Tax=Leptolyngbya sp. Cla-17 TaxID=2803751 RepID=UPI0014911E5A|nr:tetratricopeptide repeat protein [Leptolyngbya sp. Cla-17]MBM0740783.1 tetratricopeptide repeat protein [Leptolyngbya sp. Cla-17]